MFPIIFVEGLFGGAIYANTFYLASEEIEDDLKEFCMSSISFWYSNGILLSGLLGIPMSSIIKDYRRESPALPPPPPRLGSPSSIWSPSSSPVVSPSEH